MTKHWCALINDSNEILDQRSDVDCDTVVTKTGLRWVPIIDDEIPSYNPETHYIVGPEFIVEEDCVRKTWNLVSKTQEEIASQKLNKINSIDSTVMSVLLYLENKTRNTPITKEEFIEILKGIG